MPVNPSGLCMCGCGRATKCAESDDREYRRGEHYRYLAGHHPRQMKQHYIEEDRGHDTPCWIWQRFIAPNGYGRFSSRSEGYWGSAHRYYWEKANGSVPDGAHLDHLCRVRACVNPTHMEIVTCAENARRGDNAKLTYEDIGEIKRLRGAGLLQREVAEQFGVCRQTISDIERGMTWSAPGGVLVA